MGKYSRANAPAQGWEPGEVLALPGPEAARERPLHAKEMRKDLSEHTGSPVASSRSLVPVQLA